MRTFNAVLGVPRIDHFEKQGIGYDVSVTCRGLLRSEYTSVWLAGLKQIGEKFHPGLVAGTGFKPVTSGSKSASTLRNSYNDP